MVGWIDGWIDGWDDAFGVDVLSDEDTHVDIHTHTHMDLSIPPSPIHPHSIQIICLSIIPISSHLIHHPHFTINIITIINISPSSHPS